MWLQTILTNSPSGPKVAAASSLRNAHSSQLEAAATSGRLPLKEFSLKVFTV
jgi:hypothetical protein